MKHLLLFVATLLLATSCGRQPQATISEPADSVMRLEADQFLSALPEGLQQQQCAAIRTAMAGDNSLLQAVRASRNTPPTLPDGVKATILTPTLRLYEPTTPSSTPLPLLIYLHGGGWTFGSLNSCARFCAAMAAQGGLKVLAVDYRLAPEHPFPAGLDDCVAALLYAHEHAEALGIDAEAITLGGDSSGGNLAIATAYSQACWDKVNSLLLFYPVTKAYADASAAWQQYGSGYGLDADIMCAFNEAYCSDPHQPLVSVGDVEKAYMEQHLPPTLLIAAERDILCDQGAAFAAQLPERITRIEFAGAVHLFITVPGQQTAFNRAVQLAHPFITAR